LFQALVYGELTGNFVIVSNNFQSNSLPNLFFGVDFLSKQLGRRVCILIVDAYYIVAARRRRRRRSEAERRAGGERRAAHNNRKSQSVVARSSLSPRSARGSVAQFQLRAPSLESSIVSACESESHAEIRVICESCRPTSFGIFQLRRRDPQSQQHAAW
jgi:hypothetical protein